MKALSVKQPWASLICTPREDNPFLGIKDIENRTWKTNFRGRVYIHASASISKEAYGVLNPEQFDIARKAGKDDSLPMLFKELPFGAIIGEVSIIDCVTDHKSIWAEHKIVFLEDGKKNESYEIWNWVLGNPTLYEKPIPCKGKLSFWEPDIDIEECIGCEGRFTYEEMTQDDANENYCPECWAHFEPILQADYDEAVRNGEIE